MNYYIADTHFFHKNILRLNNRPFKTIIEMNETIVFNWNNRVKQDDTVYILGDFAYNTSESNVLDILNRLNGHKILITGNHDRIIMKSKQLKNKFNMIAPYYEVGDEGKKIVLFHYPLAEWNGYFRGWYHFYGHIHNNENAAFHIMKTTPHAYNVGVDVIDFMPRTAEEIINGKW